MTNEYIINRIILALAMIALITAALTALVVTLFIMAVVNKANATEFGAKETMMLVGGGLTSLLIHEGGHELVSQYRNEDIKWSGTEWDCVEECNAKAIALGGFGAQQISSHLILSFEPESDYWKSVVAFNALHTAYYVIRNELSDDGHEDLANFERRDQRRIEAVLLLSTYAAYKRWPVTTDGRRLIFNIEF